MAKIIIEIKQDAPIEISSVGMGVGITTSISIDGDNSHHDAMAFAIVQKLVPVYRATIEEGIKGASKEVFKDIMNCGGDE